MAKGKEQANSFVQLIPLLLDALRALGGSAEAREATDWIANAVKLSPADREKRLKCGVFHFANKVHWARQYLVWGGLIDSARRGVWTLTTAGSKVHFNAEQSRDFVKEIAKLRSNKPHASGKSTSEVEPGVEPSDQTKGEDAEKESPDLAQENALLEVLQSLSPGGFERLSKRLLHEYGLERVVVTGKSHDGGVDGTGVLRLNPFVTMKVLFQCKRLRGSVSRAQVGDFRNAVMGRAEKGIFITTGWFSTEAEKEASRDGVIQIELVDGEHLVELFEAKQIGLRRKEVFEVDLAFFEQFR